MVFSCRLQLVTFDHNQHRVETEDSCRDCSNQGVSRTQMTTMTMMMMGRIKQVQMKMMTMTTMAME